jgi:hypothetical protein
VLTYSHIAFARAKLIRSQLTMKILLRNTRTGLFYVGPDRWTENDPEAFNFEKTDQALDAVREGKMQSIEVLMKFENPAFEIPLSIVGCGG